MNTDLITAKAYMKFVRSILASRVEAVQDALEPDMYTLFIDALNEVDALLDKATKPKPPTIHRLSFSAEELSESLKSISESANIFRTTTGEWESPLIDEKFSIIESAEGGRIFEYDEDTNHPREEKAKLTEVIAIIDAEMERLNAEIKLLDTANQIAREKWDE